MSNTDVKFELYRGETLLGVITVSPDDGDFPWMAGSLDPAPAYAEVAHLFEREASLSYAASLAAPGDHQAMERADEALEAILEPGIRLRSLRDNTWEDALGISLEGNRVGWR